MLADQNPDPEDYRELKLDCTNKITIPEAKLSGSTRVEKGIDGLLYIAVYSGVLGPFHPLIAHGLTGAIMINC